MLRSRTTWYTEAESLQLYESYLQGAVSLDVVLDSIVPLINAITQHVVYQDADVQAQCACNALEEVWRVMKDRKVPTVPKAYSSFLDTVIRRVAISGALFHRPQEWDYPGGRLLPHGRVPDQEDALFGVQYRQMVAEARDEAISRFRFGGDEHTICCNGLDWATAGTGVVAAFLSRKYRVPLERVEWLFSYAKVTYRIALHAVIARDSDFHRA